MPCLPVRPGNSGRWTRNISLLLLLLTVEIHSTGIAIRSGERNAVAEVGVADSGNASNTTKMENTSKNDAKTMNTTNTVQKTLLFTQGLVNLLWFIGLNTVRIVFPWSNLKSDLLDRVVLPSLDGSQVMLISGFNALIVFWRGLLLVYPKWPLAAWVTVALSSVVYVGIYASYLKTQQYRLRLDFREGLKNARNAIEANERKWFLRMQQAKIDDLQDEITEALLLGQGIGAGTPAVGADGHPVLSLMQKLRDTKKMGTEEATLHLRFNCTKLLAEFEEPEEEDGFGTSWEAEDREHGKGSKKLRRTGSLRQKAHRTEDYFNELKAAQSRTSVSVAVRRATAEGIPLNVQKHQNDLRIDYCKILSQSREVPRKVAFLMNIIPAIMSVIVAINLTFALLTSN